MICNYIELLYLPLENESINKMALNGCDQFRIFKSIEYSPEDHPATRLYSVVVPGYCLFNV